jgi:hypothetical protein
MSKNKFIIFVSIVLFFALTIKTTYGQNLTPIVNKKIVEKVAYSDPTTSDKPAKNSDAETVEILKKRVSELEDQVNKLKYLDEKVKQMEKLLTEKTALTAQPTEVKASQPVENAANNTVVTTTIAPNKSSEREETRREIDSLAERTKNIETALQSELPHGTHNFIFGGYGTGRYDASPQGNSFLASFNPIFLFGIRPNLLFEGELEIKLSRDDVTGQSTVETNLETAQIDWIAHKYATVIFGKYLTPFGDFVEHRHMPWINKLVSNPLPLREGDEGGLLNFSDVGLQVRSAIPFGDRGQVLDYSIAISNGQSYESDEIGAGTADNFPDINGNKTLITRVGIRPFSYDSKIGQLRIGASVLKGKWDKTGTHNLRATGVDFEYQKKSLDFRGEYINLQRETPFGLDRRSGWYAEMSYAFKNIDKPFLKNLEPIYRFSAQEQAGVHERQHSIGLDYWLTPSVVWKMEYTRERLVAGPYTNGAHLQLAYAF